MQGVRRASASWLAILDEDPTPYHPSRCTPLFFLHRALGREGAYSRDRRRDEPLTTRNSGCWPGAVGDDNLQTQKGRSRESAESVSRAFAYNYQTPRPTRVFRKRT